MPPLTDEAVPPWPTLWEKEPGLRPTWLRYQDINAKGQIYAIGEEPWSDEPGRLFAIPADVAAALCRDAAVRWLAQRDRFLISIPDPDGVFWWVYLWNQPEPGSIYGKHETPDAALFAACTAVLDARATPTVVDDLAYRHKRDDP